MKANSLSIIILAAVLIQMTACNKEDLKPAPTDQISDLTAFSSEARITGQVRALYATIKNAGMYGGRYQIFNDIRGGDFKMTGQTW